MDKEVASTAEVEASMWLPLGLYFKNHLHTARNLVSRSCGLRSVFISDKRQRKALKKARSLLFETEQNVAHLMGQMLGAHLRKLPPGP